jgi:hypothetical protein
MVVVTSYPGSCAHDYVVHIGNIVDLHETEIRAVHMAKELAVSMERVLAVNMAQVLAVNLMLVLAVDMAKILDVHMVKEWVLARTNDVRGGRAQLLVVCRPSTGRLVR